MGRHVEEQGEVVDDVLTEELVLSHGGQGEGDDDQRCRDDVHRCRAAHDDMQQARVAVEVVDAGAGDGDVRHVLAGRGRWRERDATGRVPRAVLRQHIVIVDVDIEAPRLGVPHGDGDGLGVDRVEEVQAQVLGRRAREEQLVRVTWSNHHKWRQQGVCVRGCMRACASAVGACVRVCVRVCIYVCVCRVTYRMYI